MVSGVSIAMMIITLIICTVLPIGLFMFMKIKYTVSLKSFLVGTLAFALSAMVLESYFHMLFLNKIEFTATLFSKPIPYMIYAGLMAGLFEETARFLSFKYLLKRGRRIQDAISYGVGHGGVEAFAIVGITFINNIAFSFAINNGTLSKYGMPNDVLNTVVNQLTTLPASTFALAGLERLCAMILHIAFTLLVFKAIRENNIKYYVYAIFAHALVNAPVALSQKGILNTNLVIGMIFIFACIAIYYIYKTIVANKEDFDTPLPPLEPRKAIQRR